LVFNLGDAAADLGCEGSFVFVHGSDFDGRLPVKFGEGLGQAVGAMCAVSQFFERPSGELDGAAGVKDAQDFLRARTEELPDTVFRDGLTYWRNR
jgi:hypothetical protein